MNQNESLPYPLKSFYRNKQLTDKKIKNISSIYLVLILFLIIIVFAAFAGIFYSVILESMNIFRVSLITFIIANTIFHLILKPKQEMLELLENSKKEEIERFNSLKNRQVAEEYVKEYILPYRSIHVFDIKVLEYVIAKEDIKQLMNRATAI